MRRGQHVGGIDVRYGADPYQSILVCRAAEPNGTLLAFLHGGGWTNGYKEWMAFMAPCFTEAGVTFASVGYRLAPTSVFPVGFDDACAGVAWLAEHGSEFGADATRLFVGGHSAGGHYAALMALTRPGPAIRGCLPISGVYDFGPDGGLTARPRFLGPVEAGNTEAASPLLRIGQNPPPFFLAHGGADFPHLMAQAERMTAALTAAGGAAERLVMPGRDHFSASFAGGERDGPWVPAALAWMARH